MSFLAAHGCCAALYSGSAGQSAAPNITRLATGSVRYTAYMYMEDDTQVPWRAMSAWARATPLLEPLGLIYGFFRTEVSPVTGALVMLDVSMAVNITSAHTVHVPGCGDFVELPQPYFGMWLASHKQITRFMEHPLWQKENALAAQIPHPGGYPERTTWMMHYVDAPEGFLTRSVVQYNPATNTLEPHARVVHLRNGYSVQLQHEQGFGQLPLSAALVS